MTGARTDNSIISELKASRGCLLYRCHRLDGLVAQMFGRDKADQFRQDVLAGRTVQIKKMLLAVKGRLEVQV